MTNTKIQPAKNTGLFIQALITIIISLIFSGCLGLNSSGLDESGQNGSGAALNTDILVNLPSSIAGSDQGLEKRGSAGTRAGGIEVIDRINGELVGDVYAYAREIGADINSILNGEGPSVRNLIKDVVEPLNWKQVAALDSMTGIQGDYRMVARFDEDSDKPYTLKAYHTGLPGSPMIVDAVFGGTINDGSGTVKYFVPEWNEDIDSMRIHIDFVKSPGFKRLDVQMTNVLKSDTIADARKARFSILKQNGIIHLSVSSYHPHITGIIEGVTGHNYTFTATADPGKNLAIASVGLPPADYSSDEELFGIYGLADLLGNLFVARDIPRADNESKMLLATSWLDNMTIDEILVGLEEGTVSLRAAQELEAITLEEFIELLKYNQDISDQESRDAIEEMLVIFQLTQPVYFDHGGYEGNGEIPPANFVDLAGVVPELDPMIPLHTMNLELN